MTRNEARQRTLDMVQLGVEDQTERTAIAASHLAARQDQRRQVRQWWAMARRDANRRGDRLFVVTARLHFRRLVATGLVQATGWKYAKRIGSWLEPRQFGVRLSTAEIQSELLFGDETINQIRRISRKSPSLSPVEISIFAVSRVSRQWLKFERSPSRSTQTRVLDNHKGSVDHTAFDESSANNVVVVASGQHIPQWFGSAVTTLITDEKVKQVMRLVASGCDLDDATERVAKATGLQYRSIQRCIQRSRKGELAWLSWFCRVVVPVADRLQKDKFEASAALPKPAPRKRRHNWNHDTIADNGVIAFATCGKELPVYADFPTYSENRDLPNGFVSEPYTRNLPPATPPRTIGEYRALSSARRLAWRENGWNHYRDQVAQQNAK